MLSVPTFSEFGIAPTNVTYPAPGLCFLTHSPLDTGLGWRGLPGLVSSSRANRRGWRSPVSLLCLPVGTVSFAVEPSLGTLRLENILPMSHRSEPSISGDKRRTPAPKLTWCRSRILNLLLIPRSDLQP